MNTFAVDWEVTESQNEIPRIQLWYPRNTGSAKEIEIELSDVRAADSIRISYDFERDGWVVKQASVFEWSCDDLICDGNWKEISFIKAWALESENDML